MALQKYRADSASIQPDGATAWHTHWLGGPTLAKVSNCRIDGSSKRLTVYVTGECDTWFSCPAATRHKGKTIRGYLTNDEQGLIFHVMDSSKPAMGITKED